jgi:hypothetical protein
MTFNYFQNYYQSNGGATGNGGHVAIANGAVLTSVDISVVLTETVSSLDFTNLNTNTETAVDQYFSFLTYAAINIDNPGGGIPAIDLSNLTGSLATSGTGGINLYSIGDGSGMSGTGPGADSHVQLIHGQDVLVYLGTCGTVTVPAGATCFTPTTPSTPINSGLIGYQSLNGANGQGGSTDINPYTFTNAIVASSASAYNLDGIFQFAYDTTTPTVLTSNGGNIGFNQATTTSGSFTVIYNYDIPGAPEPTTWLLMGSALLAGFVFRKRFVL